MSQICYDVYLQLCTVGMVTVRLRPEQTFHQPEPEF